MESWAQRLHPRWFPEVARMILDQPTWEWVHSGTEHGGVVSADLRAYAKHRLLPRTLIDVSAINLSTDVAGSPLALPFAIAPLGLQRALHPEGEIGLARGASELGVATIISANTSIPVNEIASAVPEAILWLQLPNWSDRRSLASLVELAQDAGVRAIVPLVNAPVSAAHVDRSAGFRLPPGVEAVHAQPGVEPDASLSSEYIKWLTSITDLPVVPKGIMHPDDARRAVDAGARSLIISNHGCRQLPRAIGTLDALPAVVEATGTDADVLLDGGVRTGTDVLIALARGARAVLLGRPMAWALAVGGAPSVAQALGVMRDELAEVAALSGVTDMRNVPRNLVAHNYLE